MRYRPDIDGLRAIAVLLVLVFHFDLLSEEKAGFIGVDIFFVISGFLITSIIRKQLDANAFSLITFYLNRVRRLAPALFVVLLLTMLAGSVWLFPADFYELSTQALLSQFYVVNFYYWQKINYFGLKADSVFLLHTWSLAVEEQFYLLYPLAILLVHRYLKKYFWAALTLGLVLSFAMNILFVESKPEATFYLLPTRAWELLAGGLIPFMNATWARQTIINEFLGFLGFGLIVAAIVCFSESVRFPGYFALLPTCGAVCLILCGSGAATAASRFLSLSPIVYVGKISYSLYLVHWPVNTFAALLLSNAYSRSWRFAMLGLSIALSAAIYHAIEDPVRRRLLLAANARLAWGYFAGLAGTVFIFLLVHGTSGLPQRFSDDVVRIADYVNDKTAPLVECEFGRYSPPALRKADLCQIGVANRAPTWLVYGDSHAWAAHAVFDTWLKSQGEAGLFIYQHACPPLIGIHRFLDKGDYCYSFNQAIARFLEEDRGIGNVALVSAWRYPLERALSNSPNVKLSKEEAIRLFDAKFTATVEHLNKLGKHVLIWEPVPGARASVPLALALAALKHRPADIETSRSQYLSTYSFFFDALRKNRHLIAQSFSPSEALCRDERCAATADGKPVYFDTAHITKSSAEFWVRMMAKQKMTALPPSRGAGAR